MAKKRFVIFTDQIRDFYRKGWESKVIGIKGDIVLVEAEVQEEGKANERSMIMEDLINESGEC